VLVVVLLSFIALPAFAQIGEPDAGFVIDQVEVYRDADGEEDSQLWLITATIEYNTTPSIDVGQAYIVRIRDAAGVEVGTGTFYPYQDSGYDKGIMTIDFDPSAPPTWGGAYEIYIDGNPTLHWLDTTATSAMGGAVADDGGVLTDETGAANDAVVNDMTLMPAAPAINDAYYFGASSMFNILRLNLTTNGNWAGTYAYEYWNGVEWASVSGLSDPSAGFTTGAGYYDISWDCPTDWQTTLVNGVDLYWVRFRIETFTALVAQPLGAQSWVNTLAAPPSIHTDVINWIDEGSVSAAQERLTIRLRAVAQILENDWGGTTDLIETIAGEQKLTPEGEEYFTNSIDNLRNICPALFADVITTPDFGEHVVVNDAHIGSDDADYDVYGANNIYAQTFQASSAYDIDGVWLKGYRVNAPGNLTVSIRATAAGLPTGADLVSGTRSANDFTTVASGEWYWITFTDDYALTAGTTYAIVVQAAAGNVNNYFAWRYDNGDGYALGQACFYNGAVWAALAGHDFMFANTATGGFSLTYRDRLAERLVGTRFDFTNLGSKLNMSRMWVGTVIWFLFSALIAVAVVWAARSTKPATFVMVVMLPLGALAGFIYLEVALMAALLFGAGGIFGLWYSRGP